MKAKVTKQFDGCPDGELHPKQHVVGDVIEGDLAVAMVSAEFAEPIDDEVENASEGDGDDKKKGKKDKAGEGGGDKSKAPGAGSETK